MAKQATGREDSLTGRTYGYVRVSTVEQADGESLAVQRRKIEGRALELGKTLDHVYEDTASGSKPLEKRSQGRELLRKVQPGDTIVASKLDRMFRSASDALRVIDVFRRKKISLYLLDVGGDCTGDGIAKLVVTILSAVAEFERFRTRERILEIVADRRKRGLPFGGVRPPFGFTIGRKGKLQPVPKEQNAIRLIKRLREEGHSLRETAQRIKQRLDLDISHMTVQAVIRRAAVKP
jgi:putative DNA-invertase from lambdoid prophage Rac